VEAILTFFTKSSDCCKKKNKKKDYLRQKQDKNMSNYRLERQIIIFSNEWSFTSIPFLTKKTTERA